MTFVDQAVKNASLALMVFLRAFSKPCGPSNKVTVWAVTRPEDVPVQVRYAGCSLVPCLQPQP